MSQASLELEKTFSVEASPVHKFNITELVEVSPSIVEVIKQAIEMVWNKNVGQEAVFNVVIGTRIVNDAGENTTLSCEYDPDSDTVEFAMETIKEEMQLCQDDEANMLILAGHEAKHKVQFYQEEDVPRSYDKNGVLVPEYFEDIYEKDAWNEALHVFKKVYPNAKGSFYWGGQKYSVPEKSKYDD